jgi:hypothetical protein
MKNTIDTQVDRLISFDLITKLKEIGFFVVPNDYNIQFYVTKDCRNGKKGDLTDKLTIHIKTSINVSWLDAFINTAIYKNLFHYSHVFNFK